MAAGGVQTAVGNWQEIKSIYTRCGTDARQWQWAPRQLIGCLMSDAELFSEHGDRLIEMTIRRAVTFPSTLIYHWYHLSRFFCFRVCRGHRVSVLVWETRWGRIVRLPAVQWLCLRLFLERVSNIENATQVWYLTPEDLDELRSWVIFTQAKGKQSIFHACVPVFVPNHSY